MTEATVPFRAGRERYASYRIPAVVATAKGTLLAFCEGRVKSASDYGHIDIVLKRSTDGGRTWGPLKAVASNGVQLAGNPAPVVLDTGRILLVHVRSAASASEDAILRGKVKDADGRRVWVQHSDDDGVTWSSPREITRQVKKAGWRWYATTPGHALQLSTGQVVVPANHTLPPTGTDVGTEPRYNSGHCLISDDRGETWSSATPTRTPTATSTSTRPPLPNSPTAASTSTPATTLPRRATAPTPTPRTAAGPCTPPSARRPVSTVRCARAACSSSATPTSCCSPAPRTPLPAR